MGYIKLNTLKKKKTNIFKTDYRSNELFKLKTKSLKKSHTFNIIWKIKLVLFPI
jgi:hypothetical protein